MLDKIITGFYIPENCDRLALESFIEAANLGSEDRYNAIGDILWRGNVGNATREDAIKWYRKASMSGSAYSQYKLAIALLAFDKKNNMQEATNLLRSAHEGGEYCVRNILINCLNEIGIKCIDDKKLDQGLYYLVEAFDLGSRLYCKLIAANIELAACQESLVFSKYTKEEWRERFISCLKFSAERGDKYSAKKLGEIYYGGEIHNQTTERNRPRKKRYIPRMEISIILEVKDNYEESIKWFCKAGEYEIAELVMREYSDELICKKQYDEAFTITNRLVDQFRKPSYYNRLAKMYRDGLGVKEERKKSKELFSLATPKRMQILAFVMIIVATIISILYSFFSTTPLSISHMIPLYDYSHWDFSAMSGMLLWRAIKVLLLSIGAIICIWIIMFAVSLLVVIGIEKLNTFRSFSLFKDYYSLYNSCIVKVEKNISQGYIIILFVESLVIFSIPVIIFLFTGVYNLFTGLGIDICILTNLYLLFAIPYAVVLHLGRPFSTINSGCISPFKFDTLKLLFGEMILFTTISLGGTIGGKITSFLISLI